jgi:hypothetical protein
MVAKYSTIMAKTIVIQPGGYHPFHAGHFALYQSALKAFPDAEVYVAATNDTSERPFPFAIKEKLAKLAGVEPGHFVQVRSPFQAREITAGFDPEQDRLIFVRSEKDRSEPPRPGGIKKDGTPAYLQPMPADGNLMPFGQHAYIEYLPTVEFGPGMTSATQIRGAWPKLSDRRKTALVMSLYPRTQGNEKLANTVVKMLDTAILGESVNPMTANTAGAGAGMKTGYAARENQPIDEEKTLDPVASTVIDFYKPLISDVTKQPVDNYVDQAKELLQQTNSPSVRKNLIDIFKAGKQNPYIQGGIITTVGALLAGGVLSSAQKVGLSPAQTNLALQAIMNTVIPTLVSRINGRNWMDTIKYTLASAGVGTGIAGVAMLENDPEMAESHTVGYIQEEPDYIEEKWSTRYKRSINCDNPRGFSQRAHCAGRKK